MFLTSKYVTRIYNVSFYGEEKYHHTMNISSQASKKLDILKCIKYFGNTHTKVTCLDADLVVNRTINHTSCNFSPQHWRSLSTKRTHFAKWTISSLSWNAKHSLCLFWYFMVVQFTNARKSHINTCKFRVFVNWTSIQLLEATRL